MPNSRRRRRKLPWPSPLAGEGGRRFAGRVGGQRRAESRFAFSS
ncbi:hypothetical protein FTUN_2097 [Frigoriglobus tundricola]|uniref:Uncharacterized protein n=1 Tax=Frigoriglobus tundricola TaxID=2774151 RepID=A0A6M5YML0_9BACT|nr:hypothetical protein FTUN_2097 [Frigoriglobus tundricola]